ncbi:hypothetical protein C9974_17350, partial [Marinobacter sp. B9-2]
DLSNQHLTEEHSSGAGAAGYVDLAGAVTQDQAVRLRPAGEAGYSHLVAAVTRGQVVALPVGGMGGTPMENLRGCDQPAAAMPASRAAFRGLGASTAVSALPRPAKPGRPLGAQLEFFDPAPAPGARQGTGGPARPA